MRKNQVSLQNLYLCQQKSYNENWGNQSIIQNTLPKTAWKGISVVNERKDIFGWHLSVLKDSNKLLSLFAETCRYQCVMPTSLPWVLLGHLLQVRDLIWPLMFLQNYVPLVSPLVFLYLLKATFHIYLNYIFNPEGNMKLYKQKNCIT